VLYARDLRRVHETDIAVIAAHTHRPSMFFAGCSKKLGLSGVQKKTQKKKIAP
jgi:hypothetical protein